jgi:hypothetical protein
MDPNKHQMKNKIHDSSKNTIDKSWKELKMDTSSSHIHDRSLTWFGTGTLCISIKSDIRVKLVLWAQTSHLSEMMRPCKRSPHVCKMSILA